MNIEHGDYIDFRDLDKQYEELRDRAEDPDDELDEDDEETLAEFKRFDAEEFSDIASIAYNESTGVAEHEFEDYAQRMAEDCGYLGSSSDRDRNPMLNYIDWEKWARDVKMDYTEVTLDGSTYLVRSW